jgi:hypothetical protein
MGPADLLQALRKRPFEPFRIQVSDGATFDVRHPELVMVGLRAVLIGIPASKESQPVYEHVDTVSLGHVVKLLPITAGPPGNGQATEQ